MSFDIGNICSLPQNYFTPQCNCINPPVYIKNTANLMLSPYYCWYAPCLAANAIKTPEIIQAQLNCRTKNCSISIEQIKVTGGIINIENRCANELIQYLNVKNINVSLEKIVFKMKLPVIAYKALLLLLTTAIFLA